MKRSEPTNPQMETTMKVKTDPKTGKTICTLEDKDRNKLAAAKDVTEGVTVAARGTQPGDDARKLADAIGLYLAANAPAAKQPETPAK